LESYLSSLKSTAHDTHGLGVKIDEGDRDVLLGAVNEVTGWLGEYVSSATAEDFEEQKEKLSGVAYPIKSGLYESTGGAWNGGDGECEDWEYTEL